MMTGRTIRSIAILTAGVLMTAAPARAQAPAQAASTATPDSLSRAKALYASADYDQALQVLAAITSPVSPAEARDIAAYQVFCLYALGRNDEARQAVETIVKVDPLYHPSDQVSPRVRGFYEDARKPLLPDIVKNQYQDAKTAFEKKDMPAALAGFDRVIALLDEMGPSAEGGSDMRTLANGFRELAKAAIPPPPPPTPPAPPAASSAAAADAAHVDGSPDTVVAPSARNGAAGVDPSTIYGPENADVVRPIAINRTMPEWTPANAFEATQAFTGTLELVIDEHGKVISAVVTKSVRPTYDPVLLKAAQGWTFHPATRHGVPVKYTYRIEVRVGR